MKRFLITLLLIASVFAALGQGAVSENKELSRADFVPTRTVVGALSNSNSTPDRILINDDQWKSAVVNSVAGKKMMSYSNNFPVPFDYNDKIVFLRIAGGDSGVKVYVNDQYVGFSTDSKNTAEFDISQFVKQGLNSVKIEQETSTQKINREVYVFAQPKIRMRDFVVNTSLDPTYTNGLLETALLLKTHLLNTHSIKVFYDLYDSEGNLVNQANREVTTSMRGEDTVRFSATVLNVKHWNAETPNLYTVVYRVQREGRFTEMASMKVGFRTSEVKNGQFLINGKAVKIKGLNFDASRMPSNAELNSVVLKIKNTGFNAIQTAYPMSREFYDACDEFGIYVCDAANINSTSVEPNTANDPAWTDHYVNRVLDTYERNKTHASVVMWALGDGLGNGFNMYESYLALKNKSANRPIIYNDGGMEFNSDIYCPDNNASVGIEDFYGVKPILYSKCGFDKEIWSNDNIQGGFLDSGVISAENQSEISESLSPVRVRIIDAKKGTAEITNNFSFTNLKDTKTIFVTAKIAQKQGKATIKEYPTEINCAPGAKVQITLPKAVAKELASGKSEVYLNVVDAYLKIRMTK